MQTETLPEEKALLQRVANGDQQAFTILFEHYYHALGNHLFRLTRSREMAEEVVQDVFLKIWISREVLTDIRDFKSYVFIISKNHALNAVKKAMREQEKFAAYRAGADLSQDEPEETRMIENRYYSLLDEAIERLPMQQKRVYLLSRRQHKKYEEIALDMKLSRETVKKYMQHATKSISSYVRDNMEPGMMALLLMSYCQLQHLSAVS